MEKGLWRLPVYSATPADAAHSAQKISDVLCSTSGGACTDMVSVTPCIEVGSTQKFHKNFKIWELDFVHMDVQYYLPRMQYGTQRRYLFVLLTKQTAGCLLSSRPTKASPLPTPCTMSDRSSSISYWLKIAKS